jgi:hypothetical protein
MPYGVWQKAFLNHMVLQSREVTRKFLSPRPLFDFFAFSPNEKQLAKENASSVIVIFFIII